MKEKFVNNSITLIQNKYNYTNSDILDRLKYGLESIYINVTKLTVVFTISIIFNVFYKTLLFCIFINLLRMFAYGIHAKKSWQCYVASIIMFVVMPYIFSNIIFTFFQKILLSVLSLISYVLFAPADTYKRPIINKRQRKKLKLLSIIVCSLYMIIILISKNNLINSLIILAMITEALVINPISYKLFNLPYDNYKEYLKSGV